MGQQRKAGSYPVHFHMAGDVDEAGGFSRPAYARDLSIHHCFSRCVTIHGTHGLLVSLYCCQYYYLRGRRHPSAEGRASVIKAYLERNQVIWQLAASIPTGTSTSPSIWIRWGRRMPKCVIATCYPPLTNPREGHRVNCNPHSGVGTDTVILLGKSVQDTVGYDTLGHCYFLEDGNEQRNVLDHNLGLVTRPGTLLPSDRDADMCRGLTGAVYGDYTPNPGKECKGVSTFWIAHPNNVLTNNSAAGSAEVGIWYIFHDSPTGLSAGSLPNKQAERTPLGRFYNNRVHSNAKRGFMIDDRVKTTPASARAPQEYLSLGAPGQGYFPHQNADLRQPREPAIIEGLIAYKNLNGEWCRGGDIWHDKCA
ncbi:hypothetical protein Bbelb_355350 [Branchiostoma belcheri]|nr:hypothetical protein Bbelb_355350 [Branchiostoma belcheri]